LVYSGFCYCGAALARPDALCAAPLRALGEDFADLEWDRRFDELAGLRAELAWGGLAWVDAAAEDFA
jgi:hypothetical protein